MPRAAERDSYKPLIAEIAFRAASDAQAGDPAGRTAGSVIPVPAHEYLRSLNISFPQQGAWSGVIELFDATGDFLENLVVGVGKRRGIMLRFGHDGAGGLESLPLYVGDIAKYDLEFTPEGVTLTCDLVAQNILGSAIFDTVRSWPAGTRISDIVQEIADDLGILTSEDGASTIQRTSNTLPETIQIESMVNFIEAHLAPYALDESGTAGFKVTFDPWKNTLKFGNANFRPLEAVARYVFARDAWGEVISFKPNDASALAVFLGGGDASYEALDALEGVRVAVVSDRSAGIDGTDNVAYRDAGYRTDVGVPPGELSQRILMPERDQLLARARAQNQYRKATEFAFGATMTVLGNHNLRIGEALIAEYRRRDGSLHFLSGAYRIDGVEHAYSSNGFFSHLALSRTGKGFDAGAEKIDATKIVVPAITDKTHNPQAGDSVNAAAPSLGGSSGTTTLPARTGGSTPRRAP